jgi:hypothetical protein
MESAPLKNGNGQTEVGTNQVALGAIDKKLNTTETQLRTTQIKDKLIALASNPHATLHEVNQIVDLIVQAINNLPNAGQSMDVESGLSRDTENLIDNISKAVLAGLNTENSLIIHEKNEVTLAKHLITYLEKTANENATAIGRLIYNFLTAAHASQPEQTAKIGPQVMVLVAKNLQMQGKLTETMRNYNHYLNQLNAGSEKVDIQALLAIIGGIEQCYAQILGTTIKSSAQSSSVAEEVGPQQLYDSRAKLLELFKSDLDRWNNLNQQLDYRRRLLTVFSIILNLHEFYRRCNFKLIAESNWTKLPDYIKDIEELNNRLIELCSDFNRNPFDNIQELRNSQQQVVTCDSHEYQITSLIQLFTKFLNSNSDIILVQNRFKVINALFKELNNTTVAYLKLINRNHNFNDIAYLYQQGWLAIPWLEITHIHAELLKILNSQEDEALQYNTFNKLLKNLELNKGIYLTKLHNTAELTQKLGNSRLSAYLYFILAETCYFLYRSTDSEYLKIKDILNLLVKLVRHNQQELESTAYNNLFAVKLHARTLELLSYFLDIHGYGVMLKPSDLAGMLASARQLYIRVRKALKGNKLQDEPSLKELRTGLNTRNREINQEITDFESLPAKYDPNFSEFNVY